MSRPAFDLVAYLPAHPGFWTLELLTDEHGLPEAFHRHAVVAWGIDRDVQVAIPITAHGPQDWRAMLRPDGVIDMSDGSFYSTEAGLLQDSKEEWSASKGKVA